MAFYSAHCDNNCKSCIMKEEDLDCTIEYTPVYGIPIITLSEPAMEEIVKNYKVGQGCSCVPRWPYLKN